ncbi:hypothetical protein NLI96_g11691 [Meripilus lineatus]|uniref:Uncharacterized protein n=1 Tax=Meripilus lineatus TaxID=2056292 RepID=A0AAD5URB0_9APHY|nr:hypothetical protein NLI96_g11691 [Physisporinus lineatus]
MAGHRASTNDVDGLEALRQFSPYSSIFMGAVREHGASRLVNQEQPQGNLKYQVVPLPESLMSKKAKKRYETVWILMLMQETGVVAYSHMRSQNVHEGPSRVDDIEKYFNSATGGIVSDLDLLTTDDSPEVIGVVQLSVIPFVFEVK